VSTWLFAHPRRRVLLAGTRWGRLDGSRGWPRAGRNVHRRQGHLRLL